MSSIPDGASSYYVHEFQFYMRINSGLLFATLWVMIFVLFKDEEGTFLQFAQSGTIVFLLTALFGIVINRVFKNIFLELNNIVVVVFFVLRVPFLYSENVISDISIRGVDIIKIPNAFYILSGQIMVFIACIIGFFPNAGTFKLVSLTNQLVKRILRVTFFILMINAFNILFFLKLGENTLSNLFAIFFAVFNYSNLLLFLIPTMILLGKDIKKKYLVNLYIQLLIIILLVLISGSKSGLFQMFAIYIVSVLVIKGYSYKISLKGFLGATILLSVAIILFMLGTVVNKIQRGIVDVTEWKGLAEIAFEDLSVVVNAVSYRIGYLDFYIDKLTQQVYHSAFSIELYFKAFIDAVTPGFDIFHVPLVSRSVYNNFFEASEGPNSEAITVFAEAHLLVGFFSFSIYLFVIGLLRLMARQKGKEMFDNCINMLFIAYVFYRYLLGFGIDYWLFGDLLYPYIFTRCTLYFIRKLGDSNSQSLTSDTENRSKLIL